MEASQRDNIRLNTVRRIDPHVSAIVDSTARTALYSYQQNQESWAKTEVMRIDLLRMDINDKF